MTDRSAPDPKALHRVVAKATSLAVADRYQTVDEFIRALDAAAARATGQAHRRRRRLVVSLVLLVAAGAPSALAPAVSFSTAEL